MASDLPAQLWRSAQQLGDLLRRERLMVATAESCTAGGIAFAVSQIAGSSAWFAWAIRRDPTVAPWVRTTTRLFDGDRAAVRAQAVLEALDGLNVLLEQRLDV